MKSQPVPQYPWQIVSQDLCHFESDNYLVTVDHYSDFIELDELDNTLSTTIINKSKSHFARHGIPEVLLSDNGPQYISTAFHLFCELYGIAHITSSPYRPKGNGKAESEVKIVKSMMKKCTDLQLALLLYRNTPQEGHTLSPAQRCMGRRTRVNMPITKELLIPDKVTSHLVQSQITLKRERAKRIYDNVGGEHPDIPLGDYVYSKPRPQNRGSPWQYGQILSKPTPRSYVISTSQGTVTRRNRAQVRMAAPPQFPEKVKKHTYTSFLQPHVSTDLPSVQQNNEITEPDFQTSPEHNICTVPKTPTNTNLRDITLSDQTQTTATSGEASPTSLYTTRSGRAVKKPKVFYPSD